MIGTSIPAAASEKTIKYTRQFRILLRFLVSLLNIKVILLIYKKLIRNTLQLSHSLKIVWFLLKLIATNIYIYIKENSDER